MSQVERTVPTTSHDFTTVEVITINTIARARRVLEQGTSYLVAPATLIVQGVLPGSRGPLFYPNQEIARNIQDWAGVPLCWGHPYDPITNEHLSAHERGVWERQGLGHVRNPSFQGNKLQAEMWFDEQRTRKLAAPVYRALLQGKPWEISTGLFTNNEPAPSGAIHNGRPYTHIARDYRPDHLAVLHPQDKGACSLLDGCGMLVNKHQASRELVGPALTSNKWTDAARRVSALARQATKVSRNASNTYHGGSKWYRDPEDEAFKADRLASGHRAAGRDENKVPAAQAHRRAALAHQEAAQSYDRTGDDNLADLHHKAYRAHLHAHEALTGQKSTHNSLDKLGGELPIVSKQALKQADFVTLPQKVVGTNCSNCSFVRAVGQGHHCGHPDLKGQPVTNRNCCAYWTAKGTLRSWKPQGEQVQNKWTEAAWEASKRAREASAKAREVTDKAGYDESSNVRGAAGIADKHADSAVKATALTEAVDKHEEALREHQFAIDKAQTKPVMLAHQEARYAHQQALDHLTDLMTPKELAVLAGPVHVDLEGVKPNSKKYHELMAKAHEDRSADYGDRSDHAHSREQSDEGLGFERASYWSQKAADAHRREANKKKPTANMWGPEAWAASVKAREASKWANTQTNDRGSFKMDAYRTSDQAQASARSAEDSAREGDVPQAILSHEKCIKLHQKAAGQTDKDKQGNHSPAALAHQEAEYAHRQAVAELEKHLEPEQASYIASLLDTEDRPNRPQGDFALAKWHGGHAESLLDEADAMSAKGGMNPMPQERAGHWHNVASRLYQERGASKRAKKPTANHQGCGGCDAEHPCPKCQGQVGKDKPDCPT